MAVAQRQSLAIEAPAALSTADDLQPIVDCSGLAHQMAVLGPIEGLANGRTMTEWPDPAVAC